jgi:hypothetical protein
MVVGQVRINKVEEGHQSKPLVEISNQRQVGSTFLHRPIGTSEMKGTTEVME